MANIQNININKYKIRLKNNLLITLVAYKLASMVPMNPIYITIIMICIYIAVFV